MKPMSTELIRREAAERAGARPRPQHVRSVAAERRASTLAEGAPAVALRARALRWLGVLVLAAVPLMAAVIGYRSLETSSAREIGDYGLVETLHPGYFLALGTLSVFFVVFLARASAVRWLGALYVVVFTALVDGAPFLIEGAPRFPTTYVHTGFTDAIMRTGETLPLLDARFSWPGFFSLFAYLSSAAGLPDAMPLALWFPFVMKLLWFAAMWVLLRRLIRNVAACWLALWLFELVEWSGQVYFSPQSLGMLLYLVCVAVLVVAMDPVVELGPGSRAAVAVGVGTYAALVVSHQLTPFMVMAVAGLLGVFAMTRARSLWVLFAVLFMVWFSFGTTDYWVGHMEQLFGDAGQVSNTLNDNVGERLQGNVAHERIIYARMAVTIVSWGLAALGVFFAWRRRSLDARIIVLVAAPLLSLGLQSYGGEGLIRAFLFGLPLASGAGALFFMSPRRPGRRRVALVALAALLVALLPVSMLAKYGNESFESVSASELRTADWVHEHTRPGDMVASIAPAGHLRSGRVGEVDYVPALDEFETGTLRGVRRLMAPHDGSRFLVLSPSQYAYGHNVSGLPKGWQRRLLAELRAAPDFYLVHRDGPNLVYRLEGSSDAPAN